MADDLWSWNVFFCGLCLLMKLAKWAFFFFFFFFGGGRGFLSNSKNARERVFKWSRTFLRARRKIDPAFAKHVTSFIRQKKKKTKQKKKNTQSMLSHFVKEWQDLSSAWRLIKLFESLNAKGSSILPFQQCEKKKKNWRVQYCEKSHENEIKCRQFTWKRNKEPFLEISDDVWRRENHGVQIVHKVLLTSWQKSDSETHKTANTFCVSRLHTGTVLCEQVMSGSIWETRLHSPCRTLLRCPALDV